MIVPMASLTLLCLARHRDGALEALRNLGAVHLDPLQPPAGAGLDGLREKLRAAQADAELLSKVAGAAAGPVVMEAPAVIDEFRRIRAREELLRREVEDLRRNEAVLEPFGEFDRKALSSLETGAGVAVRLLRLPTSHVGDPPAGSIVEVLRRDRQAVWAIQFGGGELPAGAVEVRLPAESLGEVRARISERLEELDAGARRASGLAAHLPAVRAWIRSLEEEVDFLSAALGMAAHEEIVSLRGFCPADRVPELRGLAAGQGWGLRVGEPGADERVPTLIRNNAVVRPAQTVLNMLGILPGYREVDIGAAFLFFFSIFFAMIVGDAGYGAIFLGLTLWARRRNPGAPAHPFHLMILLSSCTILWGLLTGTVFGIAALPSTLTLLRVDWLMQESHVIKFCFILGSVHLSFAHLWNGWVNRRSLKALAQIGWMAMTWTMFLGARQLILDEPFPVWGKWLALAGLVLIVLFMTPPSEFKKEWTGHAMLPLSIVSNFVDVVSYVRLFAVGTAGLAVETSFNAMALGHGVHGVVQGLVAALILFFGHALNMLLGAMGILVHGVRLNTLEFSGHMGLTWSGVPYTPFARRTAPLSTNE